MKLGVNILEDTSENAYVSDSGSSTYHEDCLASLGEGWIIRAY
jgi:hypothetical protein